MSDQSSPQPQPPRPRPQMKRPPKSAESKFIGYLVLGFGVIAAVSVLMLAFMGEKPDLDVPQPSQQQTQNLAPKPETLIKAPDSVPPEPVKTLFFDRQPKMNPAEMDGNWQAMIGIYTAVLQMNKGVYQVILAGDDLAMPRHYSSGTYTVLEDMVTFNPRNDWPQPMSKNGYAAYQRITLAPFSLVSAFYEGKMAWQNVPPGESRVRRHPFSPLFMSQKVDYVVWQRIE